MAGIQGPDAPPDCPFPNECDTENGGSININGGTGRRRRESSGGGVCQCLSEYENGDSRASLACCSESETAITPSSRLDRLRRALLVAMKGANNNGIGGNGGLMRQQQWRAQADGNEADRSSSPSAASSVRYLHTFLITVFFPSSICSNSSSLHPNPIEMPPPFWGQNGGIRPIQLAMMMNMNWHRPHSPQSTPLQSV